MACGIAYEILSCGTYLRPGGVSRTTSATSCLTPRGIADVDLDWCVRSDGVGAEMPGGRATDTRRGWWGLASPDIRES